MKWNASTLIYLRLSLLLSFSNYRASIKKKKKTTYNPINQNSFSDSAQTIQILLFCLKSLPTKIPTKSNSNKNPTRVKKKRNS